MGMVNNRKIFGDGLLADTAHLVEDVAIAGGGYR
jgi:hypothetical protein